MGGHDVPYVGGSCEGMIRLEHVAVARSRQLNPRFPSAREYIYVVSCLRVSVPTKPWSHDQNMVPATASE